MQISERSYFSGNKSRSPIPRLLRKYVLEKLAPHFGYHTKRADPVWRENLRILKQAELQMERRALGDGMSEFLGVSF